MFLVVMARLSSNPVLRENTTVASMQHTQKHTVLVFPAAPIAGFHADGAPRESEHGDSSSDSRTRFGDFD